MHSHEPEPRGGPRRGLATALGLTVALGAAELVGGLLTGSLALLADAGHMFSDVAALGLALFAGWLAARPATPERSFGYKRAEILAALANGLALLVIALWILVEAYDRLSDPPAIVAGWMLAVAGAALGVNLLSSAILWRRRRESINVEAAFRHVIADVLGSAGVVLAALVIVTTGWRYADPLISVVIALLIVASSWTIVRDALRILLLAAPRGVNAEEVGRVMAATQGVVEVHDLHIWTVTSGFPALSAHVLVRPGVDCHAVRRQLERVLDERFGLDHTTLQVDHAGGEQPIAIGRSLRRWTPLGRR
jgi:cobalt-zinc-cadmium efflux system protein